MAQPTETITLEKALRMARENSPALQQAQNTASASASAVRRERRWFLPSLSLSAGPTQRYGLVFDQTAGELIQHSSQSMYLGANASVTLFNGFEHPSSTDQARAQRSSDEMTRQRQRATVVFNVLSQYLNVITAREQLRIQEQALIDQQEQLERTEQLTASGVQPTTDRYQQQSAVAGQKLSVNQARRGFMTAKSELVALLGLDQHGIYTFEAPPTDSTADRPDMQLTDLVSRAREQRADIQAQQAQVRAAGEAIQVAQAGSWPSLSISGRAGTSYSSVRAAALGDQFSNNRSGSIGLNLSIPLFRGAQARQQITEAEISRRNAELQLQQLRRTAAKEVRPAWDRYRLARQALPAAREQLIAAEKALTSAEQRYDIGNATFTELSEARQNFVQARSQLVQAEYEVEFQRRMLEYYTGGLRVSTNNGQ